jgi:hypothetical protein
MNLSGMGAPPHWRLLQRQAAREESAVKRNMNKDPIAKQGGEPNLGDDWRWRNRRRRSNFLPDLFDKSLPRLSAGSGGNGLRESFPLGNQFNSARLNLHHAFGWRSRILAEKDHRSNRQKAKRRSVVVHRLWAVFSLQKQKKDSRGVQ